MKGFYFSHDYDARNDINISRLIMHHGMQGYGLYWAIIEDLYRADNLLDYDIDFLAWHYRVEPNVLKSVVQDYGLFVYDDAYLCSDAVAERLQLRQAKSEKARQSALTRHSASADRPQTERNANKEKESKEQKRKPKESKPRRVKVTYPTEAEVIKFFTHHDYSEESAKQAFMYYEANNWLDSQGRKVQNWKQKMIGVWFKDANRMSNQKKNPPTSNDDILNALENHTPNAND